MVPDYLDRLLNDQPVWREDAVCAEVDPDLWYPEKGGTASPAKRLCFTCPVRSECLKDALDNQERFGIWGGLTERERRKLTAPAIPLPRHRVDPVVIERGIAMMAAGTSLHEAAREIGVNRSTLSGHYHRRQGAA